eukprot:c17594_g1_i1 orf=45-1904(+)
MPAFGFRPSTEDGFPPPATAWIPFNPLFAPAEYDTSFSSNPQTLRNPNSYPSHPLAATENHAFFEPPYDSEQDYSSCFGQGEISETSSDEDCRYSYGGETHGFTADQEEDDQHRGIGSYGYGHGDDKDHCTHDKHDNRSAYVNPNASGIPTYNTLYAPGWMQHAHISNNGTSAYSPSFPRRFPTYPDTWSGRGTTSSVDPSGFWSPSFPLTWGAYGTATSVQSPHAYDATPLAQNHCAYDLINPMQGPSAYVEGTPWSTSDMNSVLWTQSVPMVDFGMEASHAQVHITSIHGSSSNHIEGSQAGVGGLQGTQYFTPSAEPFPLKCHQEIPTDSISKASCLNEITRDDVRIGGAQHVCGEPACLPLQSRDRKLQFKAFLNGGLDADESSSKEVIIQGSDAESADDARLKDANLSSECELLLVSIYNMSTLFSEKIKKMDTKGRFNVSMLESTIGLLSHCLSKQSEDATKLRCQLSPQFQQSTQEESAKSGVQPYPLAMLDKDSAPSVVTLVRALSQEKYAQIVEEAVDNSYPAKALNPEKAIRNYKSMVAEAQNASSDFRFQTSETDLEMGSLANKLKETGIFEEHGSSSVSGDERGLDLNASLSLEEHGSSSVECGLDL